MHTAVADVGPDQDGLLHWLPPVTGWQLPRHSPVTLSPAVETLLDDLDLGVVLHDPPTVHDLRATPVRGPGPLFHRGPWEAVEGVGGVAVRDLESTDAKAMSARTITALPIAIAVALMPQDADRTPAAMAGTLVAR
jgi:hypothetical protein